MSDSLISCQPRIDEPSKPRPSSNTSGSRSAMGMVKCCQVPGRSTNLKSTICACWLRAKASADETALGPDDFVFALAFGLALALALAMRVRSFLASNFGYRVVVAEKNKVLIVRFRKSAVKQAGKRALTSNRRLLLYLRPSVFIWRLYRWRCFPAMATSPLSKREIQVLLALVKVHVALGVPIGSQTLNQREDLGVSSATIRNTLASLEEKGYVSQPHVSAGRIPSEKGYRFYVQRCMATDGSDLDEAEIALRQQLEAAQQEGNYEEILHQLARTIGDLSNQLGLVLAPRFNQGIFHKLELWRLEERRLLLIITMRGGLTKSLMVEVNCAVMQRELEILSRLFNERLHGLTMAEIQCAVEERMVGLGPVPQPVVEAVVRQIEGLSTTSGADLHVSGTRNLCLKPEFDDPSEVADLIDLVEKKDLLAQLMSERQGVVITIGSEHRPEAMGRCSMVTASYEVAGAKGAVGVIGPTRMPYRLLVNLVNCAASRAADLIC